MVAGEGGFGPFSGERNWVHDLKLRIMNGRGRQQDFCLLEFCNNANNKRAGPRIWGRRGDMVIARSRDNYY